MNRRLVFCSGNYAILDVNFPATRSPPRRANAARLSREKTGVHFSGSCPSRMWIHKFGAAGQVGLAAAAIA
jgi:hypothetical protein